LLFYRSVVAKIDKIESDTQENNYTIEKDRGEREREREGEMETTEASKEEIAPILLSAADDNDTEGAVAVGSVNTDASSSSSTSKNNRGHNRKDKKKTQKKRSAQQPPAPAPSAPSASSLLSDPRIEEPKFELDEEGATTVDVEKKEGEVDAINRGVSAKEQHMQGDDEESEAIVRCQTRSKAPNMLESSLPPSIEKKRTDKDKKHKKKK